MESDLPLSSLTSARTQAPVTGTDNSGNGGHGGHGGHGDGQAASAFNLRSRPSSSFRFSSNCSRPLTAEQPNSLQVDLARVDSRAVLVHSAVPIDAITVVASEGNYSQPVSQGEPQQKHN